MISLYIICTVLIAALIGGFLSRMHGGGDYDVPVLKQIDEYSLEAFLLSLPILAYIYTTEQFIIDGSILLLCYVVHVIGLRTGHGQWMDLGSYKEIIEPEKLDIFVELIWGPDPNEFEEGEGNYWRDFTGLAFSGLIPLLPLCAFLLYKSAIFSCIVVAFSGTLKVVGYAVAKLFMDRKFTVYGEWFRGIALWAGLTIGWFLYV